MKKNIQVLMIIPVTFWLGLFIAAGAGAAPAPLAGESAPAPTNQEIRLIVDGNELKFDAPLFIHQNQRFMVPLVNAAGIFNCQAGWLEPNQIQILKDDIYINMYLGNNNYAVNNLPRQTDNPPLINDSNLVVLPLRSLAEDLHYKIYYSQKLNAVFLQSPDFKGNCLPEENTPTPAPVPPPGIWGPISDARQLVPSWADQPIVAGYYTKMLHSSAGRVNNINLSCSKINGIVLKPGETFSFNQTVGERTVTAGYESAPVFVGKKVVPGTGGGICQTASTLYNAALEAGLKIVERYPHSLPVAYVPKGRDATVSWGSADLKFKNTGDFAVEILCTVVDDYVLAALVRK